MVVPDEMKRTNPPPGPSAVKIPAELAADRRLFLEQLAAATEQSAANGGRDGHSTSGVATMESSPLGPLPVGALGLLDRFAILLYEKIPTLALIAKGDRSTIYTRHILDSLNPLSLFQEPPGCILDIGSGGGFPGMPLAILWPGTKVVLLESRERKAGFLERTVRTMGLRNVRVACERLEEHSRKKEPVYDVVFIRAVAEVPRLIEMIAPSCLPGARWVYFAGGGIDREKLARDLAVTGRSGAEAIGTFGGRLLHGLV